MEEVRLLEFVQTFYGYYIQYLYEVNITKYQTVHPEREAHNQFLEKYKNSPLSFCRKLGALAVALLRKHCKTLQRYPALLRYV